MKKFINFSLIMIMLFSITSCQSVDSTKRGVEVSWGGETNMNKIYQPGMVFGFKWLTDDLVEYDITQQTITEKFDFNDKNQILKLDLIFTKNKFIYFAIILFYNFIIIFNINFKLNKFRKYCYNFY